VGKPDNERGESASRLAPFLDLVSDQRRKLIPLAAGILVSVVFLLFGGDPATSSDPTFGMPDSAE